MLSVVSFIIWVTIIIIAANDNGAASSVNMYKLKAI